ncbi:MAG: ABC transporter permease subunit [Phycisphaerales bacterium]|nr:ABC transporter permease subunit [Phycisphaerales bacterium]
MTTLPAHAPIRLAACPPPGLVANTLAIAQRELREAVRSRWFILYTLAFAVLGLSLSYVTAAAGGGMGLSGFGRTTAGLVNLVLLVVPLMGLTAGAGSIAGDRERGMLTYLLAQPVTRTEVLLGKYLGLSGALIACIALGLGACAAIMAWKGDATRPASLIWLGGLSLALAMGMLSLGMLVSVLARKASVAVGTGVFLWLVLVFATDLALMAGAIAMKLRIEELFAACLFNPLQVFKMWSLHAADASLDVLGPAGLYATEEFEAWLHAIFGGSLLAWIVLPLVAASLIFARRAPV